MGTVLKHQDRHERKVVDLLTKIYEESHSLVKAPPTIIL